MAGCGSRTGPGRGTLLGEGEAGRLAGASARTGRIDVRRPIRGPVERYPLALADAFSVQPEDLVATEQVFPVRVGESYHLAHRQSQRWCYAPRMTPDEVLLIKGRDSLADGRARFAPQARSSRRTPARTPRRARA
jgi:hypothetical protein